MTLKLSDPARKALHNVGTSRQGAKVTGVPAFVLVELAHAGLIGAAGGLTQAGTIARERIVDASYDVFDL